MPKLKQPPNLLYRGSADGWMYKDFHTKCDKKGPSICLFQSSNGRKCGGFTTQSWSNRDDAKQDTKSFLFSLDNKLVFPV